MNTKYTPAVIILDSPELDINTRQIDKGGRLNWLYAGKPMINHLIEELADMGVDTTLVLTNDRAQYVYESLLSVFRWDKRMTIETFNYTLTKEEVMQNFAKLADANGLVIIETQHLRSYSVKEFIRIASESQAGHFTAQVDSNEAGISYLKHSNHRLEKATQIKLSERLVTKQNSINEFHQANFDLLNGRFQGLRPRMAQSKLRNKNLWQHHHSYLHPSTQLNQNILIERECVIKKSSRLDNVILNKSCTLERGVNLKNCIVLSGAHIKPNTECQNSLIGSFGAISIN